MFCIVVRIFHNDTEKKWYDIIPKNYQCFSLDRGGDVAHANINVQVHIIRVHTNIHKLMFVCFYIVKIGVAVTPPPLVRGSDEDNM